MTASALANLTAWPIGIICLLISIRAFYTYYLSRSDMLLVLGFSMASISCATLVSAIVATGWLGVAWNIEWQRAVGSCSGGLCIFLSALVSTRDQMQRLRRWQIVLAGVYLLVLVLTPLYPPFPSPWIPAVLYCFRIIIYGAAFIRYAYLYKLKSSRFSLVMCISFVLLVSGFTLNIPPLLIPDLAAVTIIGAIIRMVGYSTLSAAYSIR